MAPTASFPDNTYRGRLTPQPGRAHIYHCLHRRHASPHHHLRRIGAGTGGAQGESTKLKMLRHYRRARGYASSMANDGGHDHVCPKSVELHVMEEILSCSPRHGLRHAGDTRQRYG